MNINQLFLRVRLRLLLYTWKLICAIFPHKMAHFTLFDGSHFDYPLNSVIGQFLFMDSFETNEIKFVHQRIAPGNIFFDVGANGGLFTIIAAKQVGETGHVYAFEPGKRELELLRHNIAINRLDNVSVIDCAVSNKSGQLPFAISHDGAMNSLAQTDHKEQQIENWQTVNVTTLDEFAQKYAIKKIDFMKIDVEGAERLVLQGATNLLNSTDVPLILCEFCDATARGFNSSGSDLWDEFVALGFRLFSLSTSQTDGEIKLTPSAKKNAYVYENLIASK